MNKRKKLKIWGFGHVLYGVQNGCLLQSTTPFHSLHLITQNSVLQDYHNEIYENVYLFWFGFGSRWAWPSIQHTASWVIHLTTIHTLIPS